MDKPHLRYKYNPETLLKLELSMNVERVEVEKPFILVWVIPITLDFILTGQLTKQYVKKFLIT